MPDDPAQTAENLFALAEALPDDLPPNPFPWIEAWLDHAQRRKDQPNPNSMTLATIDPDGAPSARVVLCRGLDPDAGYVQFYTNRRSRKGEALAAHPHAAVVMHWDHTERQVRISGPVTLAPDAESDAYFAARHPASRLGAWASDQSEPIASRDALIEKVHDTMNRFGVDLDNEGDVEVPRPPHWGGYRVWAREVELWLGSPVRIHDRARWTRELTPAGEHAFTPGPWTATRLQP
jgi:pyridoxamine 5'-phosphate oxidase